MQELLKFLNKREVTNLEWETKFKMKVQEHLEKKGSFVLTKNHGWKMCKFYFYYYFNHLTFKSYRPHGYATIDSQIAKITQAKAQPVIS